MFLDKIAFQDQSLDFRMCHNDFKISDMGNHCPDFWRMILTGLEILPHTILENHCLSHINNPSLSVFHKIDAWTVRQQFQLFLYNISHTLTSFHLLYITTIYPMNMKIPDNFTVYTIHYSFQA